MAYLAEDPWGMFLYALAEKIREGAEVAISLDGISVSLSFDAKALDKMGSLLERGEPLERVLGVDLAKLVSSMPGEELKLMVRARDLEISVSLRGEVLGRLKEAFKQNPIDGEAVAMIGKLMKLIAW